MTPHLVTISALERLNKYIYLMPGVDLTFADGIKREADLFGVIEGEVVLGEVKTSHGRFTDVQLERDVNLAERLGVDTFVMATMDSHDPAMVKKYEGAMTAINVRLLSVDQSAIAEAVQVIE